ncbi:MAG TPA: molybdopterin-guanine dinucleotide biosynthesis protein B [Rhodocyclaceae bacterium]|nr:molybdopterin-guanine dinucleotide biosynthesis protein B [Rhodocyclaceae bacterium]
MKAFGIAGYSGAGKTTLIEALIPRFINRGLRVSVIKHAHHGFDIDRPGKDSYRFREAGSGEVLVATDQRWVLMHEAKNGVPTLEDHLARFSPCDLVLVEGFKQEPIPKLEVHRQANGKPFIWPENPRIVAVASDAPIPGALPRLELDDRDAIAAFILDYLKL